MRALLPDHAADVDVHEWYAREWLEPGGVRIDFVSSVDGAATAEGKSEGLQTSGDNRVFAAMRDLADVVLIGAGTARIEGYRAIDLSRRRRALRRDFGFSEELPTAVVSRALMLDPTAPLFADAPDNARTVVITCDAAEADARSALDRVADLVVVGDESVDLVAARAALEERGLRRVLCEGGPTLFADLTAAGVVDELCLSTTPFLAGPGARRIVSGAPWDVPTVPLTLVHLLEEDDALFLRYRLQ
ncbi:MAG TPA: dihydrofolate reductase family protein [Jatrophihabitantaceae bacterium]|nr:dihydrofolate reductase family protein [Jatrophihabitantaceae bacterium]